MTILKTPKNLKLYRTIAEVADELRLQQSTLRYWEKEFPQIKPKTNGRGVRHYRDEDVQTLKLIHHLVKERGMTLQGARKKAEDNKEQTAQNHAIVQPHIPNYELQLTTSKPPNRTPQHIVMAG